MPRTPDSARLQLSCNRTQRHGMVLDGTRWHCAALGGQRPHRSLGQRSPAPMREVALGLA